MDDKYDEAIAWLRDQDRMRGSYFEEVACLMEELLGRIYELEVENVSGRKDRWRQIPPKGTPTLTLVKPSRAPRQRQSR